MSSQQRILVVDDDPQSLSIMEEILDGHYSLIMATSGEECLDVARRFQPDVVLLGIGLPGIDGYETCRRLREDPELRCTRVIMVSAKVQLDERLAGYESQADDYVTKPFDAEELLAKVRVMLRLHHTEEMDRFKSQFLDLLAHEARTPLTGILSPAQLLQEQDDLSAAERKELGEMIADSARSLLGLVQGAVELCAFRAGRVELKERRVDLSALIEGLSQELEPRAREKSIVLGIQSPRAIQVTGDNRRLEHALRTILKNAIEHGYPVSCVEIRIDDGAGGVVIEVENEGEVVAERDLPFVFEAFQVRDVAHYSKGVGVDLALAREIAVAHGGSLDCRATSTHSMVFAMVLPRVAGHGDHTTQSTADSEIQGEPRLDEVEK